MLVDAVWCWHSNSPPAAAPANTRQLRQLVPCAHEKKVAKELARPLNSATHARHATTTTHARSRRRQSRTHTHTIHLKRRCQVHTRPNHPASPLLSPRPKYVGGFVGVRARRAAHAACAACTPRSVCACAPYQAAQQARRSPTAAPHRYEHQRCPHSHATWRPHSHQRGAITAAAPPAAATARHGAVQQSTAHSTQQNSAQHHHHHHTGSRARHAVLPNTPRVCCGTGSWLPAAGRPLSRASWPCLSR